ncbi:MAG: tRNA (adenosine(37)-N6)-threonylcarbamoyltransferase complex transferase subunit TsaD [Desulfobacterales bacterium]|nr:tRNA (adenosine(37)-N6)-threonylcarbamoyltransferase complex transferase subunit TsaD [Desulfobacterales bacterium]
MIILGIETSCDETAAAIVVDGKKLLASVVSSQINVHKNYGGVVPEIASRKHIEAITYVVKDAINSAQIKIDDINAVAVTQGPGLIGSLLVGFSFAKAFAYARNIPCIQVNHLEGHINSVFLEDNPPCFPFVALLVSGGHTNIYYVKTNTDFELMGQTRDDAAGEAFDKVSKMLGLGYPGGAILGQLAEKGDPYKIHFSRPYLDKDKFDFSFSGIKTAVKRYIETNKDNYQNMIPDIAASFQESVIDVLSYKIINASIQRKCSSLAVVGGVAANKKLRERIISEAKPKSITVHIPSISLCGDNAAMIACTGFYKIQSTPYVDNDINKTYNLDVFSKDTALQKNKLRNCLSPQ